jgi:hypothetical protein
MGAHNPQAFPGQHASGMSLRDYYAGLAMQSLINNHLDRLSSVEELAEEAHNIAHAMLNERYKYYDE